MVADTSIPQISEGNQILASTMTPQMATSKLLIRGQTWVSEDSNVSSSGFICCLYRDSTANSIGGCQMNAVASNAEGGLNEHFNYSGETIVLSNAAVPTVFSMRCGLYGNGSSATMRWNGQGGGDLLGGGLVSLITITEIK